MTRRIEAKPSTGLSRIERGKVRGGRTSKRGVPVIDLSATGEGQGPDTTAPINTVELINDINQLAKYGRRSWKEHRH